MMVNTIDIKLICRTFRESDDYYPSIWCNHKQIYLDDMYKYMEYDRVTSITPSGWIGVLGTDCIEFGVCFKLASYITASRNVFLSKEDFNKWYPTTTERCNA